MNKPFNISCLNSKPSRNLLFWKLQPYIDPNERDALIKICTDDFEETRITYHGLCHGCTTPYLSKQWCKACFCYPSNNNRGRDNWDTGLDMYLESRYFFDEYRRSPVLDIIKTTFKPILIELYPEYFI